jgi:hypothetical protein
MMMLDPNLIILAKVKDLIILAKTKDLINLPMIKDLIIKSQDGTKILIIILIIKITAIMEIANSTTIPSPTIRTQIMEPTINPTLKLDRKISSAQLKVTLMMHLTTLMPRLEKRFPGIKRVYESLSTNDADRASGAFQLRKIILIRVS